MKVYGVWRTTGVIPPTNRDVMEFASIREATGHFRYQWFWDPLFDDEEMDLDTEDPRTEDYGQPNHEIEFVEVTPCYTISLGPRGGVVVTKH